MDKKNFLEGIGFLSLHFEKKLPKELRSHYWNRFKNISNEKFQLACENLIDTFVPTNLNPFPRVQHILDACGETGYDRAIAAIAVLKRTIRRVGQYQSIVFKDTALTFAVNSYGGWVAICNWTDQDWDINEKRLMDTYNVAVKRGLKDVSHIPGIGESSGGFFKVHFIKENGDEFNSKEYTTETLAFDIDKINKKIGGSTPKQIKQVDDIVNGCLPTEI